MDMATLAAAPVLDQWALVALGLDTGVSGTVDGTPMSARLIDSGITEGIEWVLTSGGIFRIGSYLFEGGNLDG